MREKEKNMWGIAYRVEMGKSRPGIEVNARRAALLAR